MSDILSSCVWLTVVGVLLYAARTAARLGVETQTHTDEDDEEGMEHEMRATLPEDELDVIEGEARTGPISEEGDNNACV